jgi:putative transposase
MQPDEAARRRLRLIDQILHLPAARLEEAEEYLACLGRDPAGPPKGAPLAELAPARDWPHAPLHRLSEQGTYIVTAGTYEKAHLFRGPDRLGRLEAALLSLAKEAGWRLEAWAVFSNHYHFIAHAGPGSKDLATFIKGLHGSTSRYVNELDSAAGRQVWFNYWDTQLTFERSYLARLNYVHQNPVKHGLVRVANQYPWCSAAWFERTASTAQVKTIYSFKIDRVKVEDDFDPL